MEIKSSIAGTKRPTRMGEHLRITCATRLLSLLVPLALPAVVQAQFLYTTNNGTITINGYTGPGGAVTIPSTITGLPVAAIGDFAFYHGANLTRVTIPNSVTNIGNWAFEGCTSLTNVSIPNSITGIGEFAFTGCGLESVTLPSTVTNLAASPPYVDVSSFYECDNLTAINVDTNNPVYSSADGVLFDKNQTTLLSYPGGKAGTYSVPDGVLRVAASAFSSAYKLMSISIGNGVTSIGVFAFEDCSALTRITVGENVMSIPEGMFEGCRELNSVTIGNNVTNVGSGAFSVCKGLINITIPGSVKSIGDLAFEGCTNLTGVFFQGDAPRSEGDPFDVFDNNEVPAIIYYLPGTTGWGGNFGFHRTMLWNPKAQTSGANFGIKTNRFGFNITGTANIPFVVEGCANLASPAWIPLQSCTLTNGSLYFSDPQWTNYPGRVYRIRSP
jgi:hypothetical protein